MTCSWPGGAQLAGWVSFLKKQCLGHNTNDLMEIMVREPNAPLFQLLGSPQVLENDLCKTTLCRTKEKSFSHKCCNESWSPLNETVQIYSKRHRMNMLTIQHRFNRLVATCGNILPFSPVSPSRFEPHFRR